MKIGLAGGTLSYRDHELTLLRSGVPEQVWMNLDYSPVTDEAGKPVGVIAIVVETTNTVRAVSRMRQNEERRTAALQQSEKTLRTVFQTSYMNQGLLTPDGKIIHVNDTALASIKGTLEEVIGKNFWETPWFTATPGMPQKVKDGIARAAAGESIQISMPHMTDAQLLAEIESAIPARR